MSLIHTFAGNPLDRADALRRDPARLTAAEADPAARCLPLWQLNVLVAEDAAGLGLGWLPMAERERLDIDVAPVFLGLQEGVPHFALDVSELGDPVHELGLPESWQFQDARRAALVLPGPDTGIVAQARAQVDWHRRHRFCSVCGERTRPERGGYVRRCPGCRSEHFPRTDPVAIMVVAEADHCLLGQSLGALARTGMYSALAGFVDQGESIEEAVRREVREEAGIEVGAVHYHSSQPWPFPSSLMIGCLAEACSTDIVIDPSEMADVRWFPRQAVRQALNEQHPTLRLPGPMAIAHHLIRAWVDGWPG
jgi:NAD+ diphosphatase